VDGVIYNRKKFKVKNDRLFLANLGIKDISEIQGLESLTDLQWLDLSGNKIHKIKGLESDFLSYEVNPIMYEFYFQ